jgi:MoxR-like ATPase
MKLFKGECLQDIKASGKFGLDPYLPSDTLIQAVQLAQLSGRPLLVKGEPGCGKSRLADAVAAELHGTEFRKHYFEWNVKSTSKAQDGLFMIDHLKRLSDANLKQGDKDGLKITLHKNTDGSYQSTGNYLKLGDLGKAFLSSFEGSQSPVVLIDEIDKADIDFPNDLLLELDKMTFKIPDAVDQHDNAVEIKANVANRPLFIITSNDEKPLPPAFLRRCLFHYISFDEIKIDQIAKTRFPVFGDNDELLKSAIEAFNAWRTNISISGISSKNISTSELIDWLSLIVKKGHQDLIKISELPPFHQALLKDVESIQLFARLK